MPTCPNCECTVTYDRLEAHQRYCLGKHEAGSTPLPAVERLDRRMTDMERDMFRRLLRLEAEVELLGDDSNAPPDIASEGTDSSR